MAELLRKSEKWVSVYQDLGAYWLHDGNIQRPHALLTSGNHSNGFFNSELVMRDPELVEGMTKDLLGLLREEDGFNFRVPELVAGPAMGAITLAHELAKHIAVHRKRPCFRAYAEKQDDKTMEFKRTGVQRGESVLIVEDVLTTGGSVENLVHAIEKSGGSAMSYVGVIVNRSGLKTVGGRKIIALVDVEMSIWKPEECPLCKNGSEAIRPKSADNWKRLNDHYETPVSL